MTCVKPCPSPSQKQSRAGLRGAALTGAAALPCLRSTLSPGRHGGAGVGTSQLCRSRCVSVDPSVSGGRPVRWV